jgi:hypothetical protein
MGNVVALGGVDAIGGGATPGADGADVIGGSATPGVDTLTPGLITFPPMIVAPMLTLIRPTLGGTNESKPAGAGGMVGVVAALATPVDAVRHNALSAAEATGSLGKCTFISLWTIDGRGPPPAGGPTGRGFPSLRADPHGDALVLQADTTVDVQTVVPPLKTDPMTAGAIAPTAGPTNDRGTGMNAGRAPQL